MRSFLCGAAALAGALGPAAGDPAMWTLSDEDTVVHLFGTIHLLPEGVPWRTAEMTAAFARADTFCVETDVIGNFADVFQATLREGIFTGEERLSDHLTDAQEADLRAIAHELGVIYEGLDVQKPWNAMFSLGEALAARSGFDARLGVEMSLLPEAAATGKAICEMESPAEHIQSISRLPMEVQVAALTHDTDGHEDVGAAIEEALDELDALVADWLDGDVEGLAADGDEAFGHAEFYDAILTRRNARWTPRVEALLEEPGVKFVAVGAAHLAGPDSLVEMLRARGHEVEGP